MTPHASPEVCRTPPSPAATASVPAPAEGASTLPNDLFFDILSRLPLRSVCRFRCVSREWSALISDPAFAAAQKYRHAEPLIVVSHSKKRKSRGRGDLRLLDMDGNTVRVIKGTFGSQLISTSIDELVCVTDNYSCVHVIDPASGKVLVDLVDRRHLPIYGFGHAVPSGAYKVVRISDILVCEVFTLGEDAGWRMSRSPPTNVCYTRESPVVVNGVMYYFSMTQDMFNFTLHRFDLESEEWKKTIKGPEVTGGHYVSLNGIRVSELNGALCIVLTPTRNNGKVNVWLLKHPNKGIWIKAYTATMMAASRCDYMPLRVTHDGGKLIFRCGGEFRVYNLDTKKCTSLWKLDNIADNVCLCNLNLDRFI